MTGLVMGLVIGAVIGAAATYFVLRQGKQTLEELLDDAKREIKKLQAKVE